MFKSKTQKQLDRIEKLQIQILSELTGNTALFNTDLNTILQKLEQRAHPAEIKISDIIESFGGNRKKNKAKRRAVKEGK